MRTKAQEIKSLRAKVARIHQPCWECRTVVSLVLWGHYYRVPHGFGRGQKR